MVFLYENPDDAVQTTVLMETSFAEVSFPTVELQVHSYIGDMMTEQAPLGEGVSYDVAIEALREIAGSEMFVENKDVHSENNVHISEGERNDFSPHG